MNRRPNKLFPLALLALLAGLTFWLQSLTDWLSASVSHAGSAPIAARSLTFTASAL